jgi:hypothetical protein
MYMNGGKISKKKTVHRFLQQHLVVQLHTYVSLALNKDMAFNLEDPLEKRFKKPSALNERLNGLLENAAPSSTTTGTAAAPSTPTASASGSTHASRKSSSKDLTGDAEANDVRCRETAGFTWVRRNDRQNR